MKTDPDLLAMGEQFKVGGLPTILFTPIEPNQKNLYVSKQELHPSAYANLLYAEKVIHLLLTNPTFKFLNRL
jgi:hypothetical protein